MCLLLNLEVKPWGWPQITPGDAGQDDRFGWPTYGSLFPCYPTKPLLGVITKIALDGTIDL